MRDKHRRTDRQTERLERVVKLKTDPAANKENKKTNAQALEHYKAGGLSRGNVQSREGAHLIGPGHINAPSNKYIVGRV